MSLWDSSEDPGERPADVPDVDKHLPDNRVADGAQNGVVNRTASRSVQTRIVIKDGRMLWIRGDGSIAATFSIIPDLDPNQPVLIIAQGGYDVYTDILGIARPTF